MSDKKKALLIINPRAGKDSTRHSAEEIIAKVDPDGTLFEFTVKETTCSGDATNLAKEFCPGHDLVICCGGDGTLNETINGVMLLGNRIPIGYLPMGSTNDLANTIGIPTDIDEFASLIRDGHTNGYDVGMVNNKFFTYVASFGPGSSMSYSTPQWMKNHLGHAAYMLNGFVFKLFSNLKEVKPLRIRFEYDGGVVDDTFFFGAVSNSTSVAGIFKYNEDDVKLDDGLLEVLLVRKLRSPFDAFRMFGKILKRDYDGDSLIFLRTSACRFTFLDEGVKWTFDGEYGGKIDDARISILNRAVDIISPANKMFLGDISQPAFVREPKVKKSKAVFDKEENSVTENTEEV